MMFIIHVLELFFFAVVYEETYLLKNKPTVPEMLIYKSFRPILILALIFPIVATNKELVNLNDCKLSTQKKNQKHNVGNALNDGLFFQTPLMTHKGCYSLNGQWEASAIHTIERNITSSCSCKCRNNDYFALKQNWCACLNSLWNMVQANIQNCNFTCTGSEKDPCGDAKYFTVYEHKVTNIATDTNLKTGPSTALHKTIFKISTTAPVTVRKITTGTNEQTGLSTTLLEIFSKISTTALPVTKTTFPVEIIKITAISVVLALVVTAIVTVLILIIRKWNRITHCFHNNTHDGANRTYEEDELEQMTSSNHRSNFPSYDVPLVFQQTHRFGSYPATDYENFAVVNNACQRLDFTLNNDVQQRSTEVHGIHFTARYNNGAKRPTKEETATSKDDEEQENLAYRISNIVADEVIYDLPQDHF